jgi:type I restriction enzyme M protein
MDNTRFLSKINQVFHNSGIKQENRFDILVDVMKGKTPKAEGGKTKTHIMETLYGEVRQWLNEMDYTDKDLVQELFMTIGSKYTKMNLEQFYTPLTISKFISSIVISDDPTKNAIDPACGTGDLLLFFGGPKTFWDIDDTALSLCLFNSQLNHQEHYTMLCKNSLVGFQDSIGKYTYVIMNPPFGTNTNVSDPAILSQFELGKNKSKQEIGILFLELGLLLLAENGILSIIVPSGFLGNKTGNYTEMRKYILKYRVLAIIEMPKNTFKRSGTGVNTYLLIIQKPPAAPRTIGINPNNVADYGKKAYEIFISGVETIGYDLTKKNTPVIYKVVERTGEQVIDPSTAKPVRDNDLDDVLKRLLRFCAKNEIENTKRPPLGHDEESAEYESMSSAQLSGGEIMDIKRYKNIYRDTIETIRAGGDAAFKRIGDLCVLVSGNTKTADTELYQYIDIGQISTPLYKTSKMYGWKLPNRAKHKVRRNDILVSKLEGKLSYCIILSDDDNIIATNGCCVLRPHGIEELYVLFANIMTPEFHVQHHSITTGSIMASASDEDIMNVLVRTDKDLAKMPSLVSSVEFLLRI